MKIKNQNTKSASKLFSIIKSHLPSAHSYADDIQLYLSFRPLESTCEVEALNAMEKCIADVRSWMTNDKLMLKDDKTEFLVIGTSKQLKCLLAEFGLATLM